MIRVGLSDFSSADVGSILLTSKGSYLIIKHNHLIQFLPLKTCTTIYVEGSGGCEGIPRLVYKFTEQYKLDIYQIINDHELLLDEE